ncbi:MAG: response regulator transcription factor [Treponemataceae bacterium]
MALKVMIVDDQQLFASSLKIVLGSYCDGLISDIAIAHDGLECLDQLKKSVPDIILMDIRMPKLDGVEVARIAHAEYPQVKIMMLTTFDDDAYVVQALNNGATGYILKNIEPTELISFIESVAAGNIQVSSSIGFKLFDNSIVTCEDKKELLKDLKVIENIRERFPSLKHREAEVLCLILKGMENYQISQKLFIAEQTVKNYTSMIYKVIGVDNRLHAIRLLGHLAQ